MNDVVEHRSPHHLPVRELKTKLNEAQQAALNTLENFGWALSFVRQATATASAIAIVHDPDKDTYCVLDEKGALDENPIWVKFRQD